MTLHLLVHKDFLLLIQGLLRAQSGMLSAQSSLIRQLKEKNKS